MDKVAAEKMLTRLMRIAGEVHKSRPDLAKRLKKVAEWMEGDTDESRFMKNFDFDGVYEGDSDEARYMKRYDDFKDLPARDSEVQKRVEPPIKDLNTDKKWKNPHEGQGPVDYHWAKALNIASARLDNLAGQVEPHDKKLAYRIDEIADSIDTERQRVAAALKAKK
jgi:hypothetical protein